MILLHGDNQPASRESLGQLVAQARQKDREIIKLDGLIASLTDFKQALESLSLFGKEKTVVVENFFSRQQSKEKKEILEYFLNENSSLKKTVSIKVIFWEAREISAAVVRKIKNWQVKKFKTPLVVFKFLDSFYPGNSKQTFSLLNLIDKKNIDFAFYMLARRVNQLILAKQEVKNGLKSLASWQRGKLYKQAGRFSLNQLLDFYKKLLEIDTVLKTGKTLMGLEYHLDLLTATL